MKKLRELFAVWCVGGVTYGLCEMIWRGFTHWTMLLIGGFCFLLLYRIQFRMCRSALWLRCLTGAGAITAIEFFSGCAVNLYWKLAVWDYSALPGNLLGQVCLPYFALWFLLSFPAMSFAEGLHRLFSSEAPPRQPQST